MNRGQRRLDVIRSEFGTACRQLQEFQAFEHELSIPQQSILLEKRGELARGIDARRQTRRVQTHERGESVSRGCRPTWVLQENCGEPHRLVAELGADRGLGGRAMVALVKKQVERAMDGRKPGRKVGWQSNIEKPF